MTTSPRVTTRARPPCSNRWQSAPVVDFLAELAGDQGALIAGIGTGRIALPLSRRGIRVHGIDLSPAMVARLAAKPGAEDIGVTIGDFATARVGRTFGLAYLVYNTIENLTTQDEQVDCFGNVAAHLDPGGCFVVEVEVPQLQRLPPGETVRAFTISEARLGFDEYDVASQSLVSHHYRISDGKLDSFSIPFRYVWPSEARPHGQAGGDEIARALGWLAATAVHQREHQAHLGLGEAGVDEEVPSKNL